MLLLIKGIFAALYFNLKSGFGKKSSKTGGATSRVIYTLEGCARKIKTRFCLLLRCYNDDLSIFNINCFLPILPYAGCLRGSESLGNRYLQVVDQRKFHPKVHWRQYAVPFDPAG